ncbi:MAG: hypothetical protein IJ160_14450, partial [Muribaculaceae bacterium]|nr:hypothetical protein [Muribaculaceae bacterium]
PFNGRPYRSCDGSYRHRIHVFDFQLLIRISSLFSKSYFLTPAYRRSRKYNLQIYNKNLTPTNSPPLINKK